LLKEVAVPFVDGSYFELILLSGVKQIVLAGTTAVEVGEVASILIEH